MKSTYCFITVLLVLISAVVHAGQGQGWQGSGGWRAQGAYGRLYNPATVEAVSGKPCHRAQAQ